VTAGAVRRAELAMVMVFRSREGPVRRTLPVPSTGRDAHPGGYHPALAAAGAAASALRPL